MERKEVVAVHSFTIVGLCKGNYLKEEGGEGVRVGIEVSKLEQSKRAISCFTFTWRCKTAKHMAGAS